MGFYWGTLSKIPEFKENSDHDIFFFYLKVLQKNLKNNEY